VDRKDNLELWRKRFADFDSAKMPVHEWCDRRGVSEHSYYYWRRKVRETSSPDAGQWLAVQVAENEPASKSCGVAIRLGAAVIELERGFDITTLSQVVKVLETERC